eukprot:3507998-Pyramimonas_sp.AAC.1
MTFSVAIGFQPSDARFSTAEKRGAARPGAVAPGRAQHLHRLALFLQSSHDVAAANSPAATGLPKTER